MITGIAEKILPGGETLVRVDGQSVLTPNAVPGDMLTLRIISKRRGVLRGEIVKVIQPGAARVVPPCPVANQCGGCALQYIAATGQAAVKSGWVKTAFNNMMDDDTAWIPVTSNQPRYRRRVRWFIGQENKIYFLGFYALASHQPVHHDHCPVITPALNAVRDLITQHIALEKIHSVQAVQLDDGIHIVLETAVRPDSPATDAVDGLPLQWWWRDEQHITRPLQKPVLAFHDLLPSGRMDIKLSVRPDDFVQGQRQGNRELISQIQTWVGSVKRVADLFCGIGNLSLPLAAATGATVFGAELNAASVRAAAKNTRALGLNATFEVANLFEAFDLEPYIGADLLILDPPRRGAKRICQQISRLLPKTIIMISCDPASGARDGMLLQQQGYRLKALRALDMFPGAGHVEAMGLWQPII